MRRRHKISTTISTESYSYLRDQVRRGRARNLAEAVDRTISEARRIRRRAALERATAEYFQKLSGRTAKAERDLESAVGQVVDEVDFEA